MGTTTDERGRPGRTRGLRRVTLTASAVTLAVLAASGTTYALIDRAGADRSGADRPRPGAVADPSPVSDEGPVEPPASQGAEGPTVLDPVPEPEAVLEPGDRGRQVRELQARLHQLAWFGPVTTSTYGPGTKESVRGFQAKRGFEETGVVDERTWRRLVRMSRVPTEAELFNRPGPTLYGPGSQGAQVREVQARLRQIAWYFGDVTGSYGDHTAEAVRGFQGKRGIAATGAVDQRTLTLLEGMTTEPNAAELANQPLDAAGGAPLDPRCLSGAALCIDKSSNSLRWVVDGRVRMTVDVRFGSAELPTREGQFSVFAKSRDHVSSLYDTPMPYAMFFSGGQAVHYSPDFAAHGYAGASHGCVNVRDLGAVSSLFDQVPIGTRVIVYWS